MIKKNELATAGLMVVLGVAAPWIVPQLWLSILCVFFFYAILAISWNMVFGYAGLFSFGHVAFAAVGGYSSAILADLAGIPPLLCVVLGGIMAGFVGVLLGMVILRVRGFYLCLVTWAFTEVVAIFLKAEHKFTGGTGGYIAPSFFEGFNSETAAYFVGLLLLLCTFLVSALLYHSRWGLRLFAVRDDIDAAESMGVRTRFWKVFGFAFGSAWAGVAGAFYAHFFNVIDPTIGGLDEMGKICLMVIMGGLGTVLGPLIGSFIVVILSELIRGWAAETSLLIFATVMILILRFVRGGFMEIIQVFIDRFKVRDLRKDAGLSSA
jgi:branched-chain amino acid transport system permease protein